MPNTLTALLITTLLLGGCVSVPKESTEASEASKQFSAPAEGMAGIYIFRDSIFGSGLRKDIWIDGKCVGESAPNTFFYKSVAGDSKHTVSTESEFSPNDLNIHTDSGQNYFIRQYIKVGVFVGGAGLELVDEEEGRKAVIDLDLAKGGTCYANEDDSSLIN